MFNFSVMKSTFCLIFIYLFVCLRVCYDVSSHKTCRNVQAAHTKAVSFVIFSTCDRIRRLDLLSHRTIRATNIRKLRNQNETIGQC